MQINSFKKIAIISCLALPSTMLSAAHAGGHMAGTRITATQENSNAIPVTSVNTRITEQLALHVTQVGLPMQDALVLSDLAMTFANLQISMRDMQTELMTGQATQDEEAALMNQARATELNEQIQLANTQLNEVLSEMNATIVSAGNVLASMNKISH